MGYRIFLLFDNGNSSHALSSGSDAVAELDAAASNENSESVSNGSFFGQSNLFGEGTSNFVSNVYLQGLAAGYQNLSSLAMPVFPTQQKKTKREWRSIGTFTTEEAMNEVRKREKVSKRKTVTQAVGVKVFYRCNNWRRTSCNYRMYAVIYSPDRIELFASGDHDHTTKNPTYVPRNYTGPIQYNIADSSSQEQVLNQLVLSATANSSHFELNGPGSAIETNHEENASTPQMQLNALAIKAAKIQEEVKPVQKPKQRFLSYSGICRTTYQLGGSNIAELLKLAAELGVEFKFNSRGAHEYCFESRMKRGKILAFADRGSVISVTERFNGYDEKSEEWQKADWNQFVYAVRGKCRNVLA